MLQIKRTDIFSYDLPKERIADRPKRPFHDAKLLVCGLASKKLSESKFFNITDFLSSKDMIVFNDTKVIPARFFGVIETGAKVECLLIKKINNNLWEALGKPFKKFKKGRLIKIDERVVFKIEEVLEDAKILISFKEYSEDEIWEKGIMPIPPYIRKGVSDSQDKVDYQTVFAKIAGSVAAPTASLHFTKELLEKIDEKGIRKEFITLHVGTPSFLPLWKDNDNNSDDENENKNKNKDESNNESNTKSDMNVSALPGEEFYIYSKDVIEKIDKVRKNGGKVVAVGTTVIRALESMALEKNAVDGEFFSTSLFIAPGFKFQNVDVMVTNFHQPATSHILLVQAFMGKDFLSSAYNYALNNNFRFLSYGDGMIVGNI